MNIFKRKDAMPAQMGKSEQERRMDAMINQQRAAILYVALFVVCALVVIGMLEQAP